MPTADQQKPVFAVEIEANLGLVHACAHRFRGRGIEYDDLYQAGCMGLIKAASAFDEGRGVRFSTYAVPVILGEIRRLFRDGGTVKVSRSIKELGVKASREKERLSLALGRDAAVSEVAERLGVSPEEVAEALAATAPPASLTADDEDGGAQIDLPVDSPEESLSDLLSLRKIMNELPEADRRLITLRYFRGLTQTRTAQLLEMTQVQVSRREKKILETMRESLLD